MIRQLPRFIAIGNIFLLALAFLLSNNIEARANIFTTRAILNVINEPVRNSKPNGLSLKEVKTAIESGARDRGWNVNHGEPRSMIVGIVVRTHYAEVKIMYSNTEYSIIYNKSNNLNYSNGMIHRNYNRWISNLRTSINQHMNWK